MEEIWKDIEGYEGLYQVSNLGKVKRISVWCGNKNSQKYKSGEKVLKQYKQKKLNYFCVNLSKKSKIKVIRVHLLVARAFIPNPNNCPIVNHIDGNKSNNKVDNLEWCTYKHNINEAIRLGLWEKRNEKVRKKVIQYDQKGNKIKEYKSLLEAEKETGVPNGNISGCCKGKKRIAGGYVWRYKEIL